MASHKYEVGQNVRFNPSRTSSLVGSQEGKIVRLLPIEEGSYLYRIKCVAENVERVAKEGDLALRSLDWRGHDTGKLAECRQMRKQLDELCADSVHVAACNRALQVHPSSNGDHARFRVCSTNRSRWVTGEFHA